MPPKKGQRQARGLARQDQILDVAFDLFANNGVRQTTIAAVADRVGLSEAGVLHHFTSKEELLLAVLHRADASFPDAEAWMAEPGGGAESLRRMFASGEVLVDRPLLCRLRLVVGNEALAAEGPARDYVKKRLDNIRRAFVMMLREGIRRGEFRDDIDVHKHATEIIAFMEGIQIQWLLDPERIDLVGAYRSFAEDSSTSSPEPGGRARPGPSSSQPAPNRAEHSTAISACRGPRRPTRAAPALVTATPRTAAMVPGGGAGSGWRPVRGAGTTAVRPTTGGDGQDRRPPQRTGLHHSQVSRSGTGKPAAMAAAPEGQRGEVPHVDADRGLAGLAPHPAPAPRRPGRGPAAASSSRPTCATRPARCTGWAASCSTAPGTARSARVVAGQRDQTTHAALPPTPSGQAGGPLVEPLRPRLRGGHATTPPTHPRRAPGEEEPGPPDPVGGVGAEAHQVDGHAERGQGRRPRHRAGGSATRGQRPAGHGERHVGGEEPQGLGRHPCPSPTIPGSPS